MGAVSASVPTSVQPTYQSASAPSIVAGQFHSVLVTTAGARESALALTCFCFSVAQDRNKNMMSLLLSSYIFPQLKSVSAKWVTVEYSRRKWIFLGIVLRRKSIVGWSFSLLIIIPGWLFVLPHRRHIHVRPQWFWAAWHRNQGRLTVKYFISFCGKFDPQKVKDALIWTTYTSFMALRIEMWHRDSFFL